MKKVLGLLAIVALASCGEGTTTESTTCDTCVVKTDSTIVKTDSTVVKADSTKKDSTVIKKK
jgi:hypothetical protein